MFTWANLLTLSRLLLVPLIVILLLNESRTPALILFLLAGLSDALDGFLARHLKQRTVLGAVLDPLADKFLLDTIYILCAWKGFLPPALAVLVVSRDVLIVGGFLVLYLFSSPPEVRPSLLSKANTLFQILTAACVLAQAPEGLLHPLFYLTGGLTVASGLHYLYLGFKLFPPKDASPRPSPPGPERSSPAGPPERRKGP
ncbi:CDP-alcohol phosphatidyltransferase family protein [Thermosulfurimonas marina]|uniref:CDP-alcohol phosphatidyltransferase family protein n=1 Tax=Thermosulfurimonas marina TaxID=2047767 RepID=UPI001B31175E|nr:CDP-alcohol phosphatidyltransferase family protein [Thermosulfurimonas marina]